jgi:site-specific recombinase XerD
VAHFSRWLERRQIEPRQLTAELVDRYLALRRRTRTAWRSRRSLVPLLKHLDLAHVIERAEPMRNGALGRYRVHLADERALSASVRSHYEATAEAFLDGRQPAKLTGADVLDFVQRTARRPGLAGRLSAIRSILRFLHVTGETASDLAVVVPSAPCWRLTSLPKALDPAQVRAVLASCDRRTPIGRRDYAVVLLMLRLGLRAGEVAALTLDDVDWVAGEIVVHGKGTVGRLPLPVDVGRALVAYLRRRRGYAPTRCLFLRHRAPCRAATSGMVIAIAGKALRRAGVASGGGHRLRHTAATLMLRRGASLTEIAQVLRHRHIDTTAIYAKVDRDALRSLAQPWPHETVVDLRTLAQPWPGGAV